MPQGNSKLHRGSSRVANSQNKQSQKQVEAWREAVIKSQASMRDWKEVTPADLARANEIEAKLKLQPLNSQPLESRWSRTDIGSDPPH
jgi:hypothetical protein